MSTEMRGCKRERVYFSPAQAEHPSPVPSLFEWAGSGGGEVVVMVVVVMMMMMPMMMMTMMIMVMITRMPYIGEV